MPTVRGKFKKQKRSARSKGMDTHSNGKEKYKSGVQNPLKNEAYSEKPY
jgi:hypothetical protein